MYLIMKSRMGLAFRAIHSNEAEAKMIGINTAKYKLIAFTISTFFAGIAGGLYVYFIQFVDNSIFSPTNSFLPLIMTVIGGLGTVSGPSYRRHIPYIRRTNLNHPKRNTLLEHDTWPVLSKSRLRWTSDNLSNNRSNSVSHRYFLSKRLNLAFPQILQLHNNRR